LQNYPHFGVDLGKNEAIMPRLLMALSFAASIVFAPWSMAANRDAGMRPEDRQARIVKLTAQIQKCNDELDRYRKTTYQPMVREYIIPMPACTPKLKQWLAQLTFYRRQNYRAGQTPGDGKNKSPCVIYGFICDPGSSAMDPRHD
jgi:hypothetical protein